MTLIELLVVLAVLAVLAGLFFYIDVRQRDFQRSSLNRALRIQCVNNLKAMGASFRVWADDHNGSFPMSVSQTNEGSREFITGANAWRHFQVMSNELSTPKVLICPADQFPSSDSFTHERASAANFTAFNNSNISFFVGIDAKPANGAMILLGDRNITNETSIKNGLLELTAGTPSGWAGDGHHEKGNILLADGSVAQTTNLNLRFIIANTGVATNRLQMPVLTP